ncbi:MAG TPA: protease pro-enzyme activation domain-containing protein [Solirubrobacteraceae bacterium]|nr:protease pro-enzyme activation domain-containing protein [Solirubrobacteraceae bacterium]
MSHFRGALIGALMAMALAPSGAAARTHSNSRVWFPRDGLALGYATKLGAAGPSQVMQIGIGLKDPNPAGEAALQNALQNPGSPDYQHFLTPAQFDSRFGVPRSTFGRVLTWLRRGGARVTETAGARNYVEISATVKQVDSLFGTRENRYRAKGITFLANDSAPSVPAHLDILTIVGLNTLSHPTTPLAGAHRGAPAPGSSVLGLSTAPASLPSIPGESSLTNAINSVLGGLPGVPGLTQKLSVPAASVPTIPAVLSPQDMWSIYDMPSDNMGQGQSIAVLGAGDSSTTVKDLAIFESEHGLPKVPVKVTDIPADGDFSDTSGNVEWELDTQASTGVAPDVNRVHLYFSEHLIDPDAEADIVKWVDDPSGPRQANASWGECETTPANATLESTIPTQFNDNEDWNADYGTGAPDDLEPVAEQTLEQGVLEGRTLFAATGDTGSSCPVLVLGPDLGAGNGVLNQGVPIVNYPTASPYVVAVGGTVLYPDSSNPPQRALEYPWPYSGGGQSFFIPEPSFQTGDSGVDRPCLSDVAGNPNISGVICRGIPDVADESGDIATSSYDIYSDELGGASSEGGTSLSSPLMVGMWTRIQAASRRGTGFADPDIYRVAENSADYAQAFNDYEAGTNGFYQALPGWDYVSGWGTPVLTPLMTYVDGRTAPIH